MNDNLIPLAANRAVYTVAETAQLLKLSRGATYAMLQRGDIPARKSGRRWVISKKRLHHWLDNLPEATPEELAEALAAAENRARSEEPPR